jgi:hypothetical protein
MKVCQQQCWTAATAASDEYIVINTFSSGVVQPPMIYHIQQLCRTTTNDESVISTSVAHPPMMNNIQQRCCAASSDEIYSTAVSLYNPTGDYIFSHSAAYSHRGAVY